MLIHRLLQIVSLPYSLFHRCLTSGSRPKLCFTVSLGCAVLLTQVNEALAQGVGLSQKAILASLPYEEQLKILAKEKAEQLKSQEVRKYTSVILDSQAPMVDRFQQVKELLLADIDRSDRRYSYAICGLLLDLLEEDVTNKVSKTYAFRDGYIPKNIHVLIDFLGNCPNEAMYDSLPPQKLVEFRKAQDRALYNESNNWGGWGPPEKFDDLPVPVTVPTTYTSSRGKQIPNPEKPLFFVFYTKELDPKIHGHDPDYKVKEKQLRLSAIKAMSRSESSVFYDLDKQFLSGLATHADPEYLEAFTTALINMKMQQPAREVLGQRLAKLQNQPELREIVNKNLKALGGSTAELPDLLDPQSTTPKKPAQPLGNEPIVPAPGILSAPEQIQQPIPEGATGLTSSTSATMQPAVNVAEQIAVLEEQIRFNQESIEKARRNANELRELANKTQGANQLVNATAYRVQAKQFDQLAEMYVKYANQLQQELLALRQQLRN